MNQSLHNPAPKVILWFKLYCGFMVLLYLATALFGVAALLFGEELDMRGSEGIFVGAICILMGGFFLAVYVLPFVAPLKKWVWIYDIVLICIGMTSCCTLPMSIPLLIYWLKPEVKEYFRVG